jgi:hypothetical protein
MPPKSSRRLVIDASIARSAGESSDLRAKASREILTCVLKVSHRIVMTSGIVAEWNKHRSRFSSTWLVKMRSLRKIDTLDLIEDTGLRERIQDVASEVAIIQAMLKDIHLIEAALATDRIVLSLDETVRGHFSRATLVIDDLRLVVWVNPVIKRERAVAWLEKGANPDASRRLGYRRK